MLLLILRSSVEDIVTWSRPICFFYFSVMNSFCFHWYKVFLNVQRNIDAIIQTKCRVFMVHRALISPPSSHIHLFVQRNRIMFKEHEVCPMPWALTYWCLELDLTRSHDVIDHMTSQLAICYFLLVSHWNWASIVNCFQDICIQINLGHDLDH